MTGKVIEEIEIIEIIEIETEIFITNILIILINNTIVTISSSEPPCS